VHQFVSPLLKKDPFTSLPDELCLRVRSASFLSTSFDLTLF
jgi:F-box and WD-40 domain protein CDC4